VDDEQLVELARQGNRDAFDQLVLRHQAAVFRAALAALRVREDAEEVAQDAFVRAFHALSSYRGDASFRTWMLTIVWRRALSRRRVARWWFRQRGSEEALGLAAEPSAGPERRAEGVELYAHVRQLIAGLPRTLRDALLLAQAGEYTYDEIASMLGIATGTVKWRVSEARRRLREALQALGYDERP
jgi:RNA polymerase sigma-70 factor (ECF subfamily)